MLLALKHSKHNGGNFMTNGQIMKTYNHIDYRQWPYFNIGIPNQWHEEGFMIYEGMIYRFADDKHDFHYQIDMKMTSQEFIDYTKKKEIKIPTGFMNQLNS
ncbi:MAG: hypothetical protein ACI85I_001121 [Arenicella sp.]